MSADKTHVNRSYEAVIGLEVHAQLRTESKIFCGDAASFGDAPNTNISVVSLAHPGTLPKLNKKAVEFAIRMGLACHCQIANRMIFDRKNYFYPDLPKGYQITQDSAPVCKGGHIEIKNRDAKKKIALNRIHLEEDAGKSIHDQDEDTLIDLNRAGTALIEIVTEPAIHSSEDAGLVLAEIRKIVRYLDICDGNMEEGSLRCDANVSVRLAGETALGKKVEIKNMNSIRNVQRAIDHEIQRQIDLIDKGMEIVSETRTYDIQSGKSFGMRMKEELNDYRYFPDPDLSPVEISQEWLNSIRLQMPELPNALVERFIIDYHLPEYDALVLTENKDLAFYFDNLCKSTRNYKSASNWAMGPIKSFLNEKGITASDFPIPAEKIGALIALVDAGKVSYTVASQQLFAHLLTNPSENALSIAKRLNLLQESDESSLQPVIDEVIKEFPLKVEEYQRGKKGIISMFMGEVMKRTKGKADPKVASELIVQTLKRKND